MTNSPEKKSNPTKKHKIFLSFGIKLLMTLATVAILPQFWEFGSNLLKSENTKRIEEYKHELHRIKFMDSLISIERHKFTERSFIDQKLILDEVQRLTRELDKVHHVTVFKAHDGGQPISTSSFKYITVMYSISTLKDVDILMDYQRRPISSGNSWAISNSITNGFTYVPNISTSHNYTGLARDYCDVIGVESLGLFYIKSLTSSYFIMIGFTEVDGLKYNKNLIIEGLNTRERLKSLIYETPNHLKTAKYES